ncbi:hypothetical protein Acr_05g0001400 [Actinidia rufa]|uniref:Uncharacterized protein n=1 Tax=Actinidia rufa TaxID=165716 RepID=A0A7J0EJ58_9ERIC|nr:hypothetical protein Acr_05g0001400 [Actinidia rufa]
MKVMKADRDLISKKRFYSSGGRRWWFWCCRSGDGEVMAATMSQWWWISVDASGWRCARVAAMERERMNQESESDLRCKFCSFYLLEYERNRRLLLTRSSESVNEGLVLAPEMKQSEGLDLDTSNNHHDCAEEGVKKEQSSEWPSSEQSIKSGKEDLTLAQFSKAAPRSPSPSSTGKRKKKPKEMHDDFCYQFRKRKKATKPCSPISKHDPTYGYAPVTPTITGTRCSPQYGDTSRRTGAEVQNPSATLTKTAITGLFIAPPTRALGPGSLGKPMSCKREKTSTNRLHSPVEVKTPTMIRAEEIKSSLGSEFPSFAKLLTRRDLAQGGESFAAAHNLVEGDVLIFQLVEPNKFKVYVVRANDLTEVDGALGLLNLDAHIKQSDTGKDDADNAEIAPNNKKRKRLKTLPLAVVKKKKKMGLPKSVQNSIQSVKQFENDSEEVGSEVLAGPRLSGSAVRFRDVKSFTDFNILIDGLCIDSELPEHIRVKYYALCCSKNTFIHARLVRGLNSKLVAGIIVKLVGFLRARLRYLLNLAFESDDAPDARRYVEAKSGKGRAEDEIRDLEAKLVELKHTSEKFCADIESLKSKAERYEHKFQEEVDAPW